MSGPDFDVLPAPPGDEEAPARPKGELYRPADDRRLVYEPRVRQASRSTFQILGKREDENTIAWGFWGGLLVLIIAALFVLGAQELYTLWDIVWGVAAVAVGVLLYRFGRRSTLEEEVLCELDLSREELAWPTGDDGPRFAIPLDEITELVFGMTRYPLSARDDDVDVHAFTLLARDARDRLVPIVEASPHKETTFEVAKFLGANTGLSLQYVGLGVK